MLRQAQITRPSKIILRIFYLLLFFAGPAGGACAEGLWWHLGVPFCQAANNQSAPQISPDGAGGAWLVWEDRRNPATQNIYGQHLDGHGNVFWAVNGIALRAQPGPQAVPILIGAGANGFYAGWTDYRFGAPRLYGQRVDAAGNTLWGDGSAISAGIGPHLDGRVASDGAGGLLGVWSTSLNQGVYAQRVSPAGNTLWASGGAVLCSNAQMQGSPQLTDDGAQGIIVVWQDNRNGNIDLYAQHVDSLGNTRWAANGLAVCTAPNSQTAQQILSDGAGGAFLVWEDYRNGEADIFGQRVDGSGNTLWAAGGLALCAAAGPQAAPQLASDGSGGVWVAWEDQRAGQSDIYMQHLDSAGHLLWSANGAAVCTEAGDQIAPQMTSDGAGGLILVWEDRRNANEDIYTQRIDAGGQPRWPSPGVPLCTQDNDQTAPQLCADGSGGALAVWQDARAGAANLDIVGQRFMRPWPNIQQVTPPQAARGRVASSLALTGYMQDDRGQTIQVTLNRAGYPSVTGTALNITGRTTAMVDFDLTVASAGAWTLTAYDSLGQTSSSLAVFTVFPPAAKNLTWVSVPAATLYTGATDILVGQFNGSIDGYDPLQSLQVENLGTAEAGADILRVKLWYTPAGGGGGVTFDPQTAQQWGEFARAGTKMWSLALSPAREAAAGCAWYLTTDISGGAQVGRTVRMSMPGGGAAFAYGGTLPATGIYNLEAQTLALSAAARLAWSPTETLHFLEGQKDAQLGEIRLQNITGQAWSLHALSLALGNAAGQAQPLSLVFDRLVLKYQGTEAAGASAPFAAAVWNLASPISIPAQGEIRLQVWGDLAPHPGLNPFCLSLPDGACINQGELLAEGAGGQAFPLLTSPMQAKPPELAAVFSTYPNPFRPGLESARIVYYAKGPGQAKIQIRALNHSLIKTVLDTEQSAGVHEVSWDGSNDQGRRVVSGAYWVQVELKYADGTRETQARKLALVR